jgi:hypothetical protein
LLVELEKQGAREYHVDEVHVLEDHELPKERPQIDRKRDLPNMRHRLLIRGIRISDPSA